MKWLDRKRSFHNLFMSLIVLAFAGIVGVIPSAAAKSDPTPAAMSGMDMGGSAQAAPVGKGVAVPVVYQDVKNNPNQKWKIVAPAMTYKVGVAYTFQVIDRATGNHEFMVVDSTADANLTKMNASMKAMPGMGMSMDSMDSQPGVIGAIESDNLARAGQPSSLSVIFKTPGTYWIGCYAMDPIKGSNGAVTGYVDHNKLGMRAKILVVK